MRKLLKTPEVRRLSANVVVVDYGSKWFRVGSNGVVTVREAVDGKVITRMPTKAEAKDAIAKAAE